MFLSQIVSSLIICLLILLSVAFFTLFERNVIGLFHLRVGPDNVSFVGIAQPLLDAFNLLTNQPITPFNSNNIFYSTSPLLALLLGLIVWTLIPSVYLSLTLNYSFFLFFCISSFMVFSVLLSGWSSNSNYSLIGSLRSIAQSISYEVVFSTLLITLIVLSLSYSIYSFHVMSSLGFLIFFYPWVVCTLAETHRAPFDFSESESELVSGFNTEYSGANFAFIFLSEYCVLLFSCMLMVMIFFGSLIPNLLTVLSLSLSTIVLSFLFIWIRITFCRFRYDFLIIIAWKSLLPFTILLILIVFSLLCV